jgi:hypothetical protein
MISSREYLDKRDVMNVIEYYQNTPVGLTKSQTLERINIDVDGLPHLPAFTPLDPQEVCERRIAQLAQSYEERMFRTVKVARVVQRLPSGVLVVLRVDGITHGDDGMTVTVS